MKRYLTALAALALIGCAQVNSDASAQTPPIIVDQFGYLPTLEKVAVIKDPRVGFDAGPSFSPGTNYAVGTLFLLHI